MIDLSKIPNNPGVYLMKDKNDEILYVGKAKNLNKRVKQYFDQNLVKKRGPKIVKMVTLIENIDFIITNTEVEALILENNLIKENDPKYNTLLKDDKTYPYIKITDESFPRLLITRKIENDKAIYFGPFTDITALNKIVELLNDLYEIRVCNTNNLPRKSCIYLQMNKCMAPCVNNCCDKYFDNIKEIKNILSGKNNEIKQNLKDKMYYYSNIMDYEKAAKYRDIIKCLDKITLKQNINNEFDSQDIIAYEKINNDIIFMIFFVRNGKLVNKESYYFKDVEYESNYMFEFIRQYYDNIIYFPNEILINENIEDLSLLKEWLAKKSKTKIIIPKKGHKKQLLDLAQKNVHLIASENLQRIKNKDKRINDEILEIKSITGKSNINRIESFDISNTGGVLNVASMVVLENGEFKKNSYRKFKLKTIGADDYTCMKEVIQRRFTDEKIGTIPDLLLIDGGKGQVNSVLEVLHDLDINICVCGMVKNDKHQTRGLYFNNKEFEIKKSYNLITRIQDETHRFAISYHRNLRTKEMLHSVIKDIPGIGDKKYKALIEKFNTIENIANASIEELSQIDLLSKKDVLNVYNFFKKNKKP